MSSGGPQTRAGTRLPGRPSHGRMMLAAALAAQLALGLLVVVVDGADDAGPVTPADTVTDPPSTVATASGAPAAEAATGRLARPAPGREQAANAAPAAAQVVAPVAVPPQPDTADLVLPEPGPPPAQEPMAPAAAAPTAFVSRGADRASDSEQIFAREHPHHAAARQREDDPSSFHWAVIVGVNDYMGRTTSTIGSVGDALTLRDTLQGHGWRGDHVLTLTDHAATHDAIVRAIEWLIRSTDDRSTVVFSFSGHLRHESGITALWPADNRFIWAGDLGRMLGAVRADRLWASLQGCHAAGLAAPGLEGPNRLVTYASRVQDKAYEDPAVGHSVMGYYLFAEGLRDGLGDRHAGNADGRVTVQEAFAWAGPHATSRTSSQSRGPQHPVLVDGLGGREFSLAVAGPPAAEAAPGDRDGGGGGEDEPRRRPWVKIPKLKAGVAGLGVG